MRARPHVAHAQRILRATLGGRGARAGHRIAGHHVSVEALSGYGDLPIIRLRYPLGELTHHEDETTAVVIWIVELLHGQHDERRPRLPVPEHWQPPWQPDYRWTLRAWRATQ